MTNKIYLELLIVKIPDFRVKWLILIEAKHYNVHKQAADHAVNK